MSKKMPHSGLAHKIALEAAATGCIIITFRRGDTGEGFTSETVTWFGEPLTIKKEEMLALFDKYFSSLDNPWTVLRRSRESPETLEESPEVSGGPRGKSGSHRGKSGSPRGKSNSLFECFGCGLLHTAHEGACPRCGEKEWRPYNGSK
jgi:hypothetical protein